MTWLDQCVETNYTEMFLEIKTILNDAIQILRWIEAFHSKGSNINPLKICILKII